ncbi:hypothetical protein BS78_08G141700 [Paspalum vaginatum]|nr:hypothetical protein BS78_08G141700 [Paspalum vaginatum]
MALDTKLILDVLNYHFDEMEAKTDRWFSGGSLLSQAASRLSTTAVAPTAVPLSPPATAASTTSGDITFVSSGGEHATAHHIVAEYNITCAKSTGCSTLVFTPTPTPVTNTTTLAPSSAPSATSSPSIAGINSATTTATYSAPTTALTALAAVPATRLAALPDASTCPSAPAPHGAEEAIQSDSPSRCSTICLSHAIYELKPVDILTAVWNAPPTMLHFTADIPQDNNKDWSLEHSQRRFITITTPSLSNSVALLCVSSRVHKASKIFEGMGAHNPLQLLPATLFAIRPWPPPQRYCNIRPSDTTQQCFSLWLPFSGTWGPVQQRSPWPPPAQCVMQLSDSVPLWPSFYGYAACVHLKKSLPVMVAVPMIGVVNHYLIRLVKGPKFRIIQIAYHWPRVPFDCGESEHSKHGLVMGVIQLPEPPCCTSLD